MISPLFTLLVMTFNLSQRLRLKELLFAFLLALVSSAANAQVNCAINPGTCQARPVPSDCQPGHHWTLIGSGIAHCVADDPPCAGGTVNHDALGNPTNCQTSSTRTVDCGDGFTGNIQQRRTKFTWMDGSVTYGSWSTTSDTCKAVPPPEPEPVSPPATGGNTGVPPVTGEPPAVCTASDVVVSRNACPAGAAGGPIEVHETVTCPGSIRGTYTTGTCGGVDMCSPSDGQIGETPCAADEVGGPIKVFQKVVCPGAAVSNYTTGSCVKGICSNGATDFPACSSFPRCPYAGQVVRKYCYTRAEYNGGGGDCIEPTMFWGSEYYSDDAQCTVLDRLEGSTGTYEGYCPGRTPAQCPPGY